MSSYFGFKYSSIWPFVLDRKIKNRKTLPMRTWLYPWLVSGRVVMKNGFSLFKETKSENMIHRKIVVLEILYLTMCLKRTFVSIIIEQTTLKETGVRKVSKKIALFKLKLINLISSEI
jgi:hypothetical protein